MTDGILTPLITWNLQIYIIGSLACLIKIFIEYKKELPTTSHVRLTKLTDKRQNNQNIARLNGTIRDRIKPMRGLGDGVSAGIMTNAFRNYYNFIKPHNSLDGMTPAQACGIGVENSENKWNELLKRSLNHIPQRNKEVINV